MMVCLETLEIGVSMLAELVGFDAGRFVGLRCDKPRGIVTILLEPVLPLSHTTTTDRPQGVLVDVRVTDAKPQQEVV